MTSKEKNRETAPTLEDTLVALEKIVEEQPELLAEKEQTAVDKFIIQLVEGELFTAITIVRTLLTLFLEEGETVYYGRSWFCRRFPWERSILTKKLQLLVREKILVYWKRKYALNVSSPFVQRIQRIMRIEQYYIDFEALLEEFTRDEREKETREELIVGEQREEQINQFYRIATKREQRRFIEELRESYFDNLAYLTAEELEEELQQKIEKQILEIVGIKNKQSDEASNEEELYS